MSPNFVEPDVYKIDDDTIVTLYCVAVIVPSTIKEPVICRSLVVAKNEPVC